MSCNASTGSVYAPRGARARWALVLGLGGLSAFSHLADAAEPPVTTRLATERDHGLDPDAHVELLWDLIELDHWREARKSADRLFRRHEPIDWRTRPDKGASLLGALRRLDRPDLAFRVASHLTLEADDAVWLVHGLQRTDRTADAAAVGRRVLAQFTKGGGREADFATEMRLLDIRHALDEPDEIQQVLRRLERRDLGTAERRRSLPLPQLVALWEHFERAGYDQPREALMEAMAYRVQEIPAIPEGAVLSRILACMGRTSDGLPRSRVWQAIDEKLVRPNIETGIALDASDLLAICQLYLEARTKPERKADRDLHQFVARSLQLARGRVPNPDACAAIFHVFLDQEVASGLDAQLGADESSPFVRQVAALIRTVAGTRQKWVDHYTAEAAAAASPVDAGRWLVRRAETLAWTSRGALPPRADARIVRRGLHEAMATAKTEESLLRGLRSLVAIARRGGHFDAALALLDGIGQRIPTAAHRPALAGLRREILEHRSRVRAHEHEAARRIQRIRRLAYERERARRARRNASD